DLGSTWNLFLTNSQGNNLGLSIWNGYVIYPSATKIGRTLIGDASGANDSYLTTLDSATSHPMVQQGSTLKIGAGRYVASLDESFTLTPQAIKLPVGYNVQALAEHLTNLYIATKPGTSLTGNINSSV